MKELFILGELMDNPMHGYLLHQILNAIIGPTRKINWGVLYPLIHSMHADGLIEQVPDEERNDSQRGRGKKKKMYRITEEGKRRFLRLMEEPIPYSPEYEVHFYTKLKKFYLVSNELQYLILHQCKDYIRYEIRHSLEWVEYANQDERIPEGERRYMLSFARHRLEKLRYDESWILQLIDEHRKNGEEIPRQ